MAEVHRMIQGYGIGNDVARETRDHVLERLPPEGKRLVESGGCLGRIAPRRDRPGLGRCLGEVLRHELDEGMTRCRMCVGTQPAEHIELGGCSPLA